MQITFDIPHVFQPGSDPEENDVVREIVKGYVRKITQSSAKTHVVPSVKKTGKTQVTFDLPNAFDASSTPHTNAKVLQMLLHCLCDIDADYLKRRTGIPALYDSGVRYGRTQVWDSIPALYARGYGDCKSLTCALVAEYAMLGVATMPVFRWVVAPDNQTNFHILVQTPYGFEDPSKVCGMGQNENAYFNRKTG